MDEANGAIFILIPLIGFVFLGLVLALGFAENSE